MDTAQDRSHIFALVSNNKFNKGRVRHILSFVIDGFFASHTSATLNPAMQAKVVKIGRNRPKIGQNRKYYRFLQVTEWGIFTTDFGNNKERDSRDSEGQTHRTETPSNVFPSLETSQRRSRPPAAHCCRRLAETSATYVAWAGCLHIAHNSYTSHVNKNMNM